MYSQLIPTFSAALAFSSLISTTTAAALLPPQFTLSRLLGRDVEPQPDANCTSCFHIINLFSFDQIAAIDQGRTFRDNNNDNAPNSFVQFYVKAPDVVQNAAAQITWDPNYKSSNQTKQEPALGQTQTLAIVPNPAVQTTPNEQATLVKWNGAGDFQVSVTQYFKDATSGQDRVRQADLIVNAKTRLNRNTWDVQQGSGRFTGYPSLWYPIYFCECMVSELADCCANKALNPNGRPQPPADGTVV